MPVKHKNKKSTRIIESIRAVFMEEEKSASKMLLAILLWFLSWYAIETFFTLFAVNHLGLTAADSGFQLTYVSLIFLIFAIPSGYIAAKFGRRKTIMVGIVLMTLCIASMYFIPVEALVGVKLASLTKVAGLYPVSLILMFAGFAWALININSLPMVVDMTDDENVGTYTGLYYFMSQTAAIVGPIVFGSVVQVFHNNYSLMMLLSPVFLVGAWFMMLGVQRGEAKKN